MIEEIFISYSRRDQEFVTRLASDLDARVDGVWFDQSTIQAGQNWHDEIMEGIRECKAFILVLSPDAMESPYVREELNKALELGKTIFPVIYRPARWADEFAPLVKDIQTINLHSGSYTDNFNRLVDGLIEAGAVKTSDRERPFLREQTKIDLSMLLQKAFGWASAWSLGWLIFGAMTFAFLFIFIALQNKAGWEDILNFLMVSFSGLIGGFAGGFVAGVLSMLTLRPYAPSIFWKHMSPSIRIWTISGPFGMMISGILTVTALTIGVISAQNEIPDCQGTEVTPCLNQIFENAYQEDTVTLTSILVVFSLLLIAVWFLTGMFAGWQVIRHIRRLEPGITSRQGWRVSAGWGCGAIIAALVMFALLVILSDALRL